jgi:hypothetical protein
MHPTGQAPPSGKVESAEDKCSALWFGLPQNTSSFVLVDFDKRAEKRQVGGICSGYASLWWCSIGIQSVVVTLFNLWRKLKILPSSLD